MKIKKTLLKKEIIPQKDGTFLEKVTKEIIRDKDSLEFMLKNIDKIADPNNARTPKAHEEQIEINKREKKAIVDALNGKIGIAQHI